MKETSDDEEQGKQGNNKKMYFRKTEKQAKNLGLNKLTIATIWAWEVKLEIMTD